MGQMSHSGMLGQGIIDIKALILIRVDLTKVQPKKLQEGWLVIGWRWLMVVVFFKFNNWSKPIMGKI